MKTTATEAALGRKRSEDALARAAELIEAERAYEAMMDERIRTESALIRAENEERKQREGVESNTPPVAMRICKQVRRTGKAIDFER